MTKTLHSAIHLRLMSEIYLVVSTQLFSKISIPAFLTEADLLFSGKASDLILLCAIASHFKTSIFAALCRVLNDTGNIRRFVL